MVKDLTSAVINCLRISNARFLISRNLGHLLKIYTLDELFW